MKYLVLVLSCIITALFWAAVSSLLENIEIVKVLYIIVAPFVHVILNAILILKLYEKKIEE